MLLYGLLKLLPGRRLRLLRYLSLNHHLLGIPQPLRHWLTRLWLLWLEALQRWLTMHGLLKLAHHQGSLLALKVLHQLLALLRGELTQLLLLRAQLTQLQLPLPDLHHLLWGQLHTPLLWPCLALSDACLGGDNGQARELLPHLLLKKLLHHGASLWLTSTPLEQNLLLAQGHDADALCQGHLHIARSRDAYHPRGHLWCLKRLLLNRLAQRLLAQLLKSLLLGDLLLLSLLCDMLQELLGIPLRLWRCWKLLCHGPLHVLQTHKARGTRGCWGSLMTPRLSRLWGHCWGRGGLGH